MRASYFDIMQ
jgi:hypothetical protein